MVRLGILSIRLSNWENNTKEKLVNKTLRSLPMRFNAEVVAIEEGKDMTKMTLYDLLSSLQTYEMNLNTQSKDNDIVLKAEVSTLINTSYFEEERNFGKLV